ncbi:DUF6609 family protein [Enterococcus sp. AZ103]|uniref:DUF6609 family protein n=1 Tax=Enterococcus sp. AZ103 TaxID=2774628 RepID=UPI003F23175F
MQKTQKFKYPRQFINGVWLITAGIATLLLLIPVQTTPIFLPNPIFFIIVYSLGLFWQLNKRTRAKFSIHQGTKQQNRWANFALILLLGLVALSIIPSIGQTNLSVPQVVTIWRLIFLSVSIHFLAFTPVHGKLMLILSILTIANVLINWQLSLPLNYLFLIDGLIKIIIGIIYVKVSPINF